ncbi:MAG TPA: hypothetical protein VN915_13090 [Elusimicrobiota bacterium]|nr:hypothetical protein [Elusimicrobiota bacterium]
MTKAAILAALLLLPAAARATPAIYGFTFPSWWKDSYDQPAAKTSLANLAKTGAKWVALIPVQYMKRKDSTTFDVTDQTASDESLRRTIRDAKALGLSVVLKPHVNCADGTPTAVIRPRDERAWFASYREFLLHYATIAREERVELFVVGTELFSMAAGPVHEREWQELIGGVRAVYPGKLTYAANWYDFALIPFWRSLDYVGIDGYFPAVGGKHPRLMAASLRAYLPAIRAVVHASGKPLLFTEVGIASQRGANRKPWSYRDFGPVDAGVQKAYFEAFLDAFSRERSFAGFIQWCWDLNPDAGGPNDKSMTVQGKPALDVLEKYFAGLNAPALDARAAETAGAARKALAVVEAGVPVE